MNVIKIILTMTPDFSIKMHQIQFRLGSAPDSAGELTALLQTP